MTPHIRKSFLCLWAASLLLAASALKAGDLDDPRYAADLRLNNSSDFLNLNSSFFLSEGPVWFRNALANPRVDYFRSSSLYDRDGDRTESVRYINDVGTLANPFNVMLLSSSSTFVYGGGSKTSGQIVTDAGGGPSAPNAATIAWTNTGAATAWYTNTNWTPNTAAAAWLTTDTAQFNNAGTATTAGINMSTASLSIGAIEVTSARTRNLTIGNSSSTPGTLTLNGTTVNSVSNVILRNASGSLLTLQDNETGTGKTMNVALGNATDNVINIDGAGGITITSSITGSGRNLTRGGSGGGVLTLGGVNTFSGTFTASTGTTNLSVNNALGGATAVSIANGATVQTSVLGLTNSINDSAAVTLNGTLDLTGGTETVASLSGTNIGASLAIGKNGTTTGSFTVGDANATSFAGVISGSRVTAGGIIFTKQGTGILTLQGTNTYSDVTAITAGGITITNNSALGATGANNGTTVASGSVLGLDGTAGSLTIGNELLTLNGTGLAATPAGALRNIAGTNSWSGAITLGSASTITSSAGTLTLTGGITNGGFLLTIDGAGGTTISTTAITGGGGLTKNGSGTLILSGNNSYSGGTTANDGLLQLNSSTALGSTSGSLTVNAASGNAAILDLNGNSISVGNLTGTGGNIWNNGPSAGSSTATLTIGTGNTGGGNYQGVISDNNGAAPLAKVALIKTGNGTITLSGANTYSGTTTINGGTLLVTGSTGSGSAVTVNNSGTLGGTGTVGGTVDVKSGGTLSPGTSVGTLTTGAVTLENGSTFAVDLTAASGNDVLVSSSVTLGTILTGPSLALSITGTLSLGQQFFIVNNTGASAVNGVFAQGATVSSGAYTFLIDYLADFGSQSASGGNDIMLEVTAIPETSTWIGAALALGAIAFTARRKVRGLIARKA